MLYFPNAKINIGLNVTSKRPDNYHNLETVFYPIPLCDALEVVQLPEGASESQITLSGIVVDGDPKENLVMRAWQLLATRFDLPAVDIYLHKIIPFGAGLGGGSADAAFMLRLTRDLFQLPMEEDELLQLAATLGADCPFFLLNKPTFAAGIGNEFSPIDLSLKGYKILLIKPEVAVSTVEAYALVKPAPSPIPVKEAIAMPISEWREHLANDFEMSVFHKYPELARIKEQLYEAGAIYASMSGSGSTLFGIFEASQQPKIDLPNCFVWEGILG